MSIDTLTIDEFMHLTIEDHEEALELYADATQATAKKLVQYEPGTTAHEDCLDKMARQLTLRRVHQVRLEEMQEESAPRMGSAQYAANELAPAA